MRKQRLFWVLYITGAVFVLAGAVNFGFSYYFMAIPFMVFILWVSKSKLRNTGLFYFSIVFIALSIIISYTQTENPVLFPIISDGYVEVLKDGYQRTFVDDGSGGFVLEKDSIPRCTGCGEVKYTKISKGEVYQVLGVRVGHLDFGRNISVVTEIGEFSEYDYAPLQGREQYIKLNKPTHAKIGQIT